jgi:1-deoxyxylulose-5-phosphate synthase
MHLNSRYHPSPLAIDRDGALVARVFRGLIECPNDHLWRPWLMGETLVVSRPLGHSGLTISRVALGCGNFGGVGSAPAFFGQGLTQDQAFELMDAAWEFGLTHFDTADAYGGGRSETAIGRWIASRGVRPQLTTKTFNPMRAGADHGLKPERITRQLQASLERLGVGYVELYLAHEFDPDVPLPDTLGAFEQARAGGAVGAYGVSNFTAAQLDASLAAGAPSAVQNNYSLLARQDSTDVLALCAGRGVSYLAFSPLAGGWLTGKYRRGEPFPAGSRMTQRPEPYHEFVRGPIFDALDRLAVIAADRGISMGGLALAWLLADERVGQIVVGPGRPEHLAPVGEALRNPLTIEEAAMVERALG